MIANELASCMADMTPVHAHSVRTWSMNLIEKRKEAKLLRNVVWCQLVYEVVNIMILNLQSQEGDEET